MPVASERQALIRAILTATEDELELYFQNLERDDKDDEDDEDDDISSESDGDSQSNSSSSTSSTSSTSSSSTSSSDSSMRVSSESEGSADIHLRNLTTYTEILEQILASRTLNPRTTVPKSSQLFLVLVEYRNEKPHLFRRNLRVLPETFDALVARIKDHYIFANRSNSQQFPVEIQLAIALYRFGHDGNACSVESVAQWAGVSVGLVIKATRRVIVAFLSLHNSVIYWPTEEEKEEAREWVECNSCPAWRNGYCMVDGTLIPLFEKPGHHGEAYYDRKSNYSLNVQLITLPNLRIIDYVVGYCGSAHDATVFRESRTYASSHTLFEKDEWIWADSAYALDTWCVTPYKKPLSLRQENVTFNYHLSKVRVKSEHAMGYIKGRFCSLRNLRQQIDNAKDHEHAVAWIKACLVIHTLIFFIEQGHEDAEHIRRLIDDTNAYEESQGLGKPGSDDTEIASEVVRESRGRRKREFLKAQLRQYHDEQMDIIHLMH